MGPPKNTMAALARCPRTLRVLAMKSTHIYRRQSTNATHLESSSPLKVWWDADCPLCTREISFMKRLDKYHRIEFVALTKNTSPSDIAATTGTTCPKDKRTLLARFHAQEHGHEIVDGAAAFAAMWRQIPALRWIGIAAKNDTVLWVVERLYRGFLVIRPSLQKWARKTEK